MIDLFSMSLSVLLLPLPQVTSVTNVNPTCTGLVWKVVPRVGVALPVVLHYSVINTDSALADLV